VTAAPFGGSLLRAFQAGVVLLVAYGLLQLRTATPLHLLGGALLAFFALLPVYLWCAGKVAGLPIFPLCSFTYLMGFALPMLQAHEGLARYPIETLIQGTLTTCGFLGLATLVWWWVVRKPVPPPTTYLSIPEQGGASVFFGAFLVGLALQLCIMQGWLPTQAEIFFTLIRSVSLSLVLLAVTVLSDRWGRRQLRPDARLAFVALVFLYFLITLPGLMLAPNMALSALAIAAFTLARGRIPIAFLVVAFALFTLLHLGKWPMRAEQTNGRLPPPRPQDYPAYYARWFGYGFAALTQPDEWNGRKTEKHTDLLERASVLQMLLLVEKKSPNEVPFLMGRTYVIIPELLIPRVIHPNKPWAQEGLFILSTHYGLQTRKQTRGTTIAFGLLAEAYANFSYAGVAGLAVLLGGGLALVTRWSRNLPLTSFRGLCALLCMAAPLRMGDSASVAVTALFQGSVTLTALALLTMKVHSGRRVVPVRVPPPRVALGGTT
jgi:hypothetical protein